MVLTLSRLLFSPRWYTPEKGFRRGSTGMSRLVLDPATSRLSLSHASTTCRPSVPSTYLEFSLMVLEGIACSCPVDANDFALKAAAVAASASFFWFRLLRTRKMIMPMMAASAKIPTLNPAIAPAPSPLSLL